jgi:hypothetical protein
MGSMPRLKKKDEYRYRKGSTNESSNCRYCTSFQPDFDVPGKGKEPRCNLMGLNESIRYRVRPDHTCNAHCFDGTDFSKVYR